MVVDSSALASIAFAEPDADIFDDILRGSRTNRISVVTLVECASLFAGRRSPAQADELLQLFFDQYALLVEPADALQWRLAAQALYRFGKGRHPARLNFGDSFAYALAKATGEPLLFKGDDFIHTDIERARA